MSSGNVSVSCFLEVSFLLFKSKMQVSFCCNFADEVASEITKALMASLQWFSPMLFPYGITWGSTHGIPSMVFPYAIPMVS